MNVGVLTTSYPRTPDDPSGHFVRGHAEWLAAHVGDVTVLACDDAPEGGLPHALRSKPWLAAQLTARLVRAAHRQRFDAVVCHWLVPCALVGLSLRVPGVAIAHGSDVALLRRLPGGRALAEAIARRFHLAYVDESLRMTDAGIVQQMPSQQNPRVDRATARRALHLDGKVALFLGRLVKDKGCDLLLDALPEGVTLLVAGAGPQDLSKHPAVLRGQARLLGEQRGADKARLLAAADFLVVPSRKDGAPTVIGEAHAAGLPVLGTRVGGIPACIGSGGAVVAPTVDALQQEIARFDPGAFALPTPRSWAGAGPNLWPFPVAAHPEAKAAVKVVRY